MPAGLVDPKNCYVANVPTLNDWSRYIIVCYSAGVSLVTYSKLYLVAWDTDLVESSKRARKICFDNNRETYSQVYFKFGLIQNYQQQKGNETKSRYCIKHNF